MELINLGSRLVNYLRPANEPHWKLPQTGINNPVGHSTVSIWNSEEECHFCPLGAMNSNLDSHIAKTHTSVGSTEILNEELGIPTGWWIPEANMGFETSLGWEYLFQRPEVRGFRIWVWACASMPRKIPYGPASTMSSPKRAEHSAGGGRRGCPRCLARGPHLQEVLAGWSLGNRGMQNFHLKFTAWVGLLRLLTGIPRWVERKAEHKRPTNGFKNRSYALETFISFFFFLKHSFQPSLLFVSFPSYLNQLDWGSWPPAAFSALLTWWTPSSFETLLSCSIDFLPTCLYMPTMAPMLLWIFLSVSQTADSLGEGRSLIQFVSRTDRIPSTIGRWMHEWVTLETEAPISIEMLKHK